MTFVHHKLFFARDSPETWDHAGRQVLSHLILNTWFPSPRTAGIRSTTIYKPHAYHSKTEYAGIQPTDLVTPPRCNSPHRRTSGRMTSHAQIQRMSFDANTRGPQMAEAVIISYKQEDIGHFWNKRNSVVDFIVFRLTFGLSLFSRDVVRKNKERPFVSEIWK